jgi:hypothetical protein
MLQGSFDTFDFSEVLAMLASKDQSGRLRLHYGTASVDLFLHEGRLARAEYSEHGSPSRLADTPERLEEACFEVLRWEHGSFEFHPGALPNSTRSVEAEVDAVLEGARRRLAEWDTVQAIIPSLEVQPRLAPELSSDSVVVTRQAWRVLAAVDGRRNGQALSRTLGMSPYELSALLAGLVNEGLLQVNQRPKVTVAAPEGSRSGNGSAPVRLPRPGPVAPSPPEVAPSEPEKQPPSEGAAPAERHSAFARLTGRKVRPANG